MTDLHAAVRALPTGEKLLRIALETAAREGMPVFPIWVSVGKDRRGLPKLQKKPRTEHSHKDATRDPDAIKSAFLDTRANLFGVPMGEASGRDALDVDPRHGGHVWEAANRAKLIGAPWHATMSGGRHYFFRHAVGVRNSEGRIAAGIDVRGEGGWVVWWPAAGYSTGIAS